MTRIALLALLAVPPLAWSAAPAINIDLGRQLFVDDLLIAETNLARHFHSAQIVGDGPVLQPETPLELNAARGKDAIPVAAPFGDGVWFDPAEARFKMWYHAGWFDAIALATSADGIHWERPALDVTPRTNRVLPVREQNGHRLQRDAASVWLDSAAGNPAQRWKMFIYSRLQGGASAEAHGELFTSPDGVHWQAPRSVTLPHGDNTSIFYDPFRHQWVLSIREHARALRDGSKYVRARFLHTAKEFAGLAAREDGSRAPLWLKLDGRDRPDAELGYEPELYTFTAAPYESLMLGVFGVFYGPPNEIAYQEKRPKIIDLELGYSRDGFVYDRPSREPFLKCARTPGAWNRGYLHPATGVCLTVGDKLYFYFGAWSGLGAGRGQMYAGGSTGLATLRRDGFASMDAAAGDGTLTTWPVVFSGKFAFANVAASAGALKAEILDEEGHAISPFTLENAVACTVDSTKARLAWKGAADLSALSGKAVRFRFHLTNGELYSFWVSARESGASGGYVAAGGPGYANGRDE